MAGARSFSERNSMK